MAPAEVLAFLVPPSLFSLCGTSSVTLRFFLEEAETSSAFLILESSGELPGMFAGEVLVELVELTTGVALLMAIACCCW